MSISAAVSLLRSISVPSASLIAAVALVRSICSANIFSTVRKSCSPPMRSCSASTMAMTSSEVSSVPTLSEIVARMLSISGISTFMLRRAAKSACTYFTTSTSSPKSLLSISSTVSGSICSPSASSTACLTASTLISPPLILSTTLCRKAAASKSSPMDSANCAKSKSVISCSASAAIIAFRRAGTSTSPVSRLFAMEVKNASRSASSSAAFRESSEKPAFTTSIREASISSKLTSVPSASLNLSTRGVTSTSVSNTASRVRIRPA